MSLYTEREKLPDAHHPNDSVSESISPYELVACGPISHPNIWAALRVQNVQAPPPLSSYPLSPSFVRFYIRVRAHTARVVCTKGNPHGDGVKTVTRLEFACTLLDETKSDRHGNKWQRNTVSRQLPAPTTRFFLLLLLVHLITRQYVSNGRSAMKGPRKGASKLDVLGRPVCQRRIRVTEKAALRRFVRRFVGCLVVLVMKNFVVKRRCVTVSRKGK